ncbi:MAG: hypothetical protein A3K22_05590 [Deltaproteobacteria bacterium RBG_16_42_7]|nr:MAG: hypothetical protein A3K22_05590 [Deltaproteobacteria bacterium RBG_16_42_7]
MIETSAAVATSAAVFFAAWQLRQTKKQAVTSFEDQLASEYRLLARTIPASALLGEELENDKFTEARECIYNYIDLSNEQVFLRHVGRVSRKTWEYWREGIKSNLSKPVFARVWDEVKQSVPESFQELQRLEREGFSSDPKGWR